MSHVLEKGGRHATNDLKAAEPLAAPTPGEQEKDTNDKSEEITKIVDWATSS